MKIQSLAKMFSRLRPLLKKGHRGSLRPFALTFALLALSAAQIESAAPPAGTSIGNQASATYTDASNTPRTATSNVAITIVQQVASFTLTTDGQAKFAPPGGQVFYPHTLVNTGNGSDNFTLSSANAGGDDFDLTSLALYADANGDGLPDNSTAITTTGPLVAGATFKFVAVGIVPANETAARTAAITVTAVGTATGTPAAAQNNTDTTTVTSDAVINVTKAMSSSSGAAGSGPYTITISYNNIGNNSATNVTLMDVIPSGMAYVSNSARWSVTTTTTLTDADNSDAQGTAPDTIKYDYYETVAGRVTAVINRVQSGQSGTLTFQVNIASGQAAGTINNTPTYSYDPGTGTPVGPFNGNTVQFTVTQGTGVTITGQTIASASQGSTVAFTNVVVNTGNGTDSFDITVTNTSFPAGTTFTLYQSDGNTPLVDSTGNGIPDTGPLTASQSYNVILKAVLPTGSSGVGVGYTALVTATSRTSSSTTANANDVLTTVTGNTVDLSNGASGGAGAGPEGSPVVVNASNPNTTTRFTLSLTNTSGVADSYNLAASTNSTFGTVALPTGWSVVFRDTSEGIITSSGVLIAGTNKTIYADVTIPAGNAPGTNSIYFRALSPTSGASDRLHDAVAVNTVRAISLTPNNNGQIVPGGAVVYSHLIQNNGNLLEGDGTASSVNLAISHTLSGWSSLIYYDANNNGIVDSGDTVVTNLAFTSAGGTGLAVGETVRLLVKVFAPPGTPLGAIDAATITATTVNGTYTTTVPSAATATDNTTVISGDVVLLKEQALDASPLDGVADTAYGTADITTGALPGKGIRYRITVTNQGSAPATAVKVYDTTPAFTVYTTTVIAATTVGSVTTTPVNGAAGPLEFNVGTLNPGQSAVITFGVIINQ